MDVRLSDKTTQLKELVDRAMSKMSTCVPGVIDSFDADTQTVTVRPAIKMKTFIDNESSSIELPQIINAPIVFPFASTAGFALTLPVRKNDPCIILFSQRAIDNWHDLGGVQPSEEGISSRHHDLTDAIVLLAAPPIPSVLGSWESEGIELRNRPRNSYITVKDDSIVVVRGGTSIVITDDEVSVETATVDIAASTEMNVTSPVTTFSGLVNIGANLVVTGTVTNNGVNIGSTHKHPQGNDSDGDTQQNTGSPQ